MRLRRVVLAGVCAAVLGGGGLASVPPARSSAAVDCGPTTLEGTMVKNGTTGILECAPGDPLVVREELAPAAAGRATSRSPLAAFLTLADFQYADEESPLRGEWADKCGSVPTSAAFRPFETMVGQMMNAHVLAANRISASGSPVLGVPFDFTAALGDLADNQQYNETRFFIDLLDGMKLLDPNSGDPGYIGVQIDDPDGADSDPLASPTAPESLRDLANQPFWGPGLRNADGSAIPWYTVMGNHDMKVQGTIRDDDPAWRALVRAYVVGQLKIMELPPDEQQEACAGGFTDPAFWVTILTNPTLADVVPADPDRRLLDKEPWVDEHFATTGTPVGHGFADESRRCPNESYPDHARRTCYWWEDGIFRYLVLDTNPAEGLQDGNLDDAQFRWLEEQLKSVSRTYYRPDGEIVHNDAATNRLVTVIAHHPLVSLTNEGPRTGSEPGSIGPLHTADALEALLLRFPNVVLLSAGHTHMNKVWAHQHAQHGTGFWEVNTSAIADYPSQSRTIEIADNEDGTLSIFSVVFDALGAPNPRDIDWSADDMTNEVALAGAARAVNEQWLASAGREIQANDDDQQSFAAIGAPEDRNVELLVGRPFRLPSPAQIERCLDEAGRLNPVIGTPGRDVLLGTLGPDLFCGFGGRDSMRGLDGGDLLLGGPGRDHLQGGKGRDRLRGEGGADVLLGGRGRDRLIGAGGRDRCSGGRGRDRQRSC